MDLDTLYADALAGDTEAIAELEKNVDRLSYHDRTILHVESMYGHPERVRSIMKIFEQKNLLVKLDKFKKTALHLAADHGHTEVVELLIDAARALSSPLNDVIHNPVGSYFEAFIRQADEKMNTALHLAVSNNHMDIVKLIVEADPSDRHIQNHNHETPIYIAAKLGYIGIVKLICDACSAPSLDGPHSTSALHPLIMNWNNNIKEENEYLLAAKELLKAAKRSACHGDAPYNSFEGLFNITDQDGYNVLQLAVMANNRDAVELILKEDPEYQHRRSTKNSELKSLAYIAAEKVSKDIVKLLCETYEARNEIGRVGQTTLHAAIIGRDKVTAIGLLESDPHLVTWEDHRGWTPLHYAAYYGFDAIIRMMLATQLRVGYQFVPSENVPPPLFVAVEQGHLSTVKQYLLELSRRSGPISTGTNYNGQNILHIMAFRRNKEMIKAVLDFCEYHFNRDPEEYIDLLNEKDRIGNTPLHILVCEGCYVSEFIKSAIVDKNARNNEGWTPVDMLYFSEKVTDDQVRIRIEIDNIQANQKWKFWHRSIKHNPSLVIYGMQFEKDEFMKAKKLLIEEEIKRKKDEFKLVKDDLERYRQRTNTQIIVTALITTVTFTVGFTLPGGYHQSREPDQGLALLSRKTAFKAFMVSDALALVLSTSSLFFYFTASMSDDPLQVSKMNAASTVLNILSIIGMMLTFITGTYVVLSHSPALAIIVCLICCFFFILVIVQSIKMIYDRRLQKIHIV